jgi:hypothetical protein
MGPDVTFTVGSVLREEKLNSIIGKVIIANQERYPGPTIQLKEIG